MMKGERKNIHIKIGQVLINKTKNNVEEKEK